MARNRFSRIARESAERTTRELAADLAQLTRMTQPEIEELLPRRADREHFVELMKIVDSSAAQNRKLRKLQDRFEDFGPILLKILGRVV
jgi:hypothetical protein